MPKVCYQNPTHFGYFTITTQSVLGSRSTLWVVVMSGQCVLGSLTHFGWFAKSQPPLLDPKRARIHVPGLKSNPLFHEFGRQKVPLFLTNREFSCVKYTPYFRVFITGIVATRSICTTFNGTDCYIPVQVKDVCTI